MDTSAVGSVASATQLAQQTQVQETRSAPPPKAAESVATVKPSPDQQARNSDQPPPVTNSQGQRIGTIISLRA